MVVGASGLRTNQYLFFFQQWRLALEFALTTVFKNKHMTKARKPESFKMKLSGLVISSVQVWFGVLPILVLPVSLWIPRGQRLDSKPLDWKREGHELDWMLLWQAPVHGALHELLIFLNFTTTLQRRRLEFISVFHNLVNNACLNSFGWWHTVLIIQLVNH